MSHHWHIVTSNENRDRVGVLKYWDLALSINDYLDFLYNTFPSYIDNRNRIEYHESMRKLGENEINYHIYASTPKLTLSWLDCIDDPCSFPNYN